MLIYFARHGQTDDNLRGIIQGHADTPLNAQGRIESGLLAEHLKELSVVEIWSSDLSRALETAKIVAAKHSGLVVRTTTGLKDRYFGSLQGKTWPQNNHLPDDVEAVDDFRSRIIQWFKAFHSNHADRSFDSDPLISRSTHGHEPVILVITHSAYMDHLISILLSLIFSFTIAPHIDQTRQCENASIMRVKCAQSRAGKWDGVIESWAEDEHLVQQLNLESVVADSCHRE